MGRWAEKWKALETENPDGATATKATRATLLGKQMPTAAECSPSSPSSSSPDPKLETPAWVDVYEERRAIAEIDGGASPDQAHAQALWEAVQTWEAAHPLTPPPPGHCVACGQPVAADVAIKMKDGGRAYLAHDFCGQRLHLQRQEEAAAALAAHGITEEGPGR